MEDRNLLVAHWKERCSVLGPDERFVIWVQGCPFRCKGCIAEAMQSFEGGELVPVEEMAKAILETDGIEGITVSGGEPFLQAEELAELFETIKRKKDLGIIVYTGFLYEKLKELAEVNPEIGRMLSQIDLLIDGPYDETLNEDYGYKGSSNQRTISFTERYKDQLHLYNDPATKRVTELYTEATQNFLAGVPSKDMKRRWKDSIQKKRGEKTV